MTNTRKKDKKQIYSYNIININLLIKIKLDKNQKLYLANKLNIILYGDWGLGIGDWGLGIGDWAQSPIPNPQSPFEFI